MKKMFLNLFALAVTVSLVAESSSVVARAAEQPVVYAVESESKTAEKSNEAVVEENWETDEGTTVIEDDRAEKTADSAEAEKIVEKTYDYYDDTLPIEEIYSNPADLTEFPTAEFGKSTEHPMLASYVGDPNWGDHRQFARMAPADASLTAGDSVAKIILKPDQKYWLTEYLVNTAAEDGEAISGLKLFLDFPDHMRAGEQNYLYAYLQSDNDAGGNRVCRVEMVCNQEIWLRPVDKTMACTRGAHTDDVTFFSDLEFGMKTYEGEMRVTLTMDWPENFGIQGGSDAGYFAMTLLETLSENPSKKVVYAESKEEFDELIGDTEFTGSYEDKTTDTSYEPAEEKSKKPSTFMMVVIVVLLLAVAYSFYRLAKEVRENARIERYFRKKDDKSGKK